MPPVTDQVIAGPYAPISDEDRRTFQDQGLLLIPGALRQAQRDRMEEAVDRVYDTERRAGRLGPNGEIHALAGVLRDEAFAELLDHPKTFPHLWGHLGWNIYVNHSHVDVNPPVLRPPAPAWLWHQDGKRQNADLDMDPRPMFSIKVAYVLSDLSERGRGGTLVLPGHHHSNTLERPEPGPGGEHPRPPGAVEITAKPGDAFIFDRRLWHARSLNHSTITRKMIFMCYTYRWIRWYDDVAIDPRAPWWQNLSPVRRQLLGDGDGTATYFGISRELGGVWDEEIPLRAELKARGLLDRSRQFLR